MFLTKLANEIKYTQSKRAFIELALIKMMHHQEALYVDQLALINELLERVSMLEKAPKTNTPIIVTKEDADKEPLVTIEMVERILHEASKEKKDLLNLGWPHLENYPSAHLKLTAHMLFKAELVAVSNQAIFACDDLVSCEQLLNPNTKKQVLSILNSKQEYITDYVAILKADWQKIQSSYLASWKQGNKNLNCHPWI